MCKAEELSVLDIIAVAIMSSNFNRSACERAVEENVCLLLTIPLCYALGC